MMLSVVWAGGGFGVVLDRDHGQGAMTHALDTLIVEVDVRDFDFRRQTLRTHCKPMIV
jgi:hypothetical protein